MANSKYVSDQFSAVILNHIILNLKNNYEININETQCIYKNFTQHKKGMNKLREAFIIDLFQVIIIICIIIFIHVYNSEKLNFL